MTPCCMNCYFRYFSKYDAPCEDCVDTSNWEPEVTPDTRKVITDTEVKQEYRAVRSEILHKAEECVCGHRVEDYGTPEDNFRQIADLWTAYLDHEITPLEVATMMVLFKIARTQSGTSVPTHDSYVDMAGYAACAGEIAHLLRKREGQND